MKETINKTFIEKQLSSRDMAPLKKFGQNFLIDPNLAEAIVRQLNVLEFEKVLEIGPGFGSLSVHLSDYDKSRITLCDIDHKIIIYLKETFAGDEHMEIIEGDVLKTDFSKYDKVIGNLPYNLTTELVTKIVMSSHKLKKAIIMMQKEAYERLTSPSDSKDYGHLSVMLAYIGETKKIYDVPAGYFYPRPGVDSVVVKIDIRENLSEDFVKRLYQTSRGLFLNRRKNILNNLTFFLHSREKAAECLKALEVDSSLRPEQLSPDFYVKLTNLTAVLYNLGKEK